MGVEVIVVLIFADLVAKGFLWSFWFGFVRDIAGNLTIAITLGIFLSLTKATYNVVVGGIVLTVVLGIIGGIALIGTFIIAYIVGYYRIPLYLVSSLSVIRAYFATLKNPLKVFAQLHRSSLYWDEQVFLPLLGLKNMLLIASEINIEGTLEEIGFIVSERPQQIRVARTVALEMTIQDLEIRETIRDISQASSKLAEILPHEVGLLDPRWVIPLIRLNDASRDAASYLSPIGWQVRHEALEDMIANLKRIRPTKAFGDAELNRRLGKIVETWLSVARQEMQEMEQAPEKTSLIYNPYNPGPVLNLRDSLFVGRRDLAKLLTEILSRGRGQTFLLRGERRMGKSSTLRQLPILLGARYIPITYDLQIRGMSANTFIFLSSIADEIYKAVSERGIRLKKLEFGLLKKVDPGNEAEIYHFFDRWLDGLEQTLDRENRTLLLAFDEFEKLADTAQSQHSVLKQSQHLDLKLLLDWFRSTIQHRSRLVLLFSGIRAFGEMGPNWAGYFINVQTLKVSFLLPEEARHLVTQPVPNFPGQQVFGEDVVDEIIRLTGCQPFLVQAVCSALIDHLNANRLNRAELEDVEKAVDDRVLKNWKDTYFRDLWERTDKAQRRCLIFLSNLGEGSLAMFEKQAESDGMAVHRTLERLEERDLVFRVNGNYRITIPLISRWLEPYIYGDESAEKDFE